MARHRLSLTLGYITLALLLGACQAAKGSVQGRQLDINYAMTTGGGSTSVDPLNLPHGRYTFFSYADPPDCLKSVALIDHAGIVVADDVTARTAALAALPGTTLPPPNSVSNAVVPTMVQQELKSGRYQLKVTARTPSCAWQVQQILNYVLSDEPALSPVAAPSASNVDVVLGNSSTGLHFQIPTTGLYQVQWSVTPCDRYSADLIRSDGGTQHLGDGAAVGAPPGTVIGPQSSDSFAFLAAGDWTARVATKCYWRLEIRPQVGSMGGGTQGFAR